MKKQLALALLLVTASTTAAVADGTGAKTTRQRKVRSLMRVDAKADTFASVNTVRDGSGRVRQKVTRVDTTGGLHDGGIPHDGAITERRQRMRKDSTVKRETISYAEQSRGRASMSKTIAWRKRDGSIRFAVGIGVGFRGRLPLKLHVKTPIGTLGGLPSAAVPRDRGARGRAPRARAH